MDYHDPRCCYLTRTALTCFMSSRRDYHDIYVAHTRQRPKPRRCQIRGVVLHAILVEGKRTDELLVAYPDSCLKENGDLNGKPAAQFRADNPGKMCLKNDEMAELVEMLLQVQRNPIIAGDISDPDAKREHEIRTTINGVACKTRLDLWRPGQNPVDYKFMDAIDPDSFRRSARSYLYWLQDAHYTRVSMTERLTFRCVEVSPPFRVHDYWYSQQSRQMAFDKHDWLLEELKTCRETGDWSEVWTNEIEVRPWELFAADDELVTVEGDL